MLADTGVGGVADLKRRCFEFYFLLIYEIKKKK